MSKRSYFSQYESPNIVIVPTVSFCDASERKKKRLRTDCRDPRITSENARKSKIDKTEFTNLANNNCVPVENIKSNCHENISLRNKHSSNLDHKHPDMVLNESRDTKISQNKKNISSQKKVITQSKLADEIGNTDGFESTISSKKYFILAKNITETDINKLSENISNKTYDSDCSKNIKSSDSASLKSTDNHYSSSSRKVKGHNKHDGIRKHKILRNLSINESQHCDVYTDSKENKDKTKRSTEVIKDDTREQSAKRKPAHRNSEKEQLVKKSRNDKSRHKTESEITNLLKLQKQYNTDINHSSHKNDSKKCTNKHKNDSQINNEINKYTSTSRKKYRTNHTDYSSDHKKRKIHRENDTNKDNTKNRKSIKESCTYEQGSHEKMISKNNSEHNNKKHRLKLSQNDTKRPTKEKKLATNSKSSRKENSNVYENLTVTVETQSEKHENLKQPNTKKYSKSHKTKGLKLIINLVVQNENTKHIAKTLTQIDKNCVKTEPNKTPSLSNSELSFLDDINIDEIVDSLKQPKIEIGAKKLQSLDTNSSDETIIITDDESDIEEIIDQQTTNDGKKMALMASVKTGKSNKTSDEEIITNKLIINETYNINKSEVFFDKKPVVSNPSLLPVEHITKQEDIENNIKLTPKDTTEDDTIEALSDCSTVILGDLDQFEIEDCSYTPEEYQNTLLLGSTEATIEQSILEQNNIESAISHLSNQSEETVLLEETQETTSLRDPIEAQLKKMFEMNTSDINDNGIDKSVTANINNAEKILSTSYEKTRTIALSPRNKKLHLTQHTEVDNTNNEKQNMPQEKSEGIVLSYQKDKQNTVQYTKHLFLDNTNNDKHKTSQEKGEVIVLPLQNKTLDHMQLTVGETLNSARNQNENMSKTNAIALPHQMEKQNPVPQTKRVSLYNTNNEKYNTSQGNREGIVLPHKMEKQNPVPQTRVSLDNTNNEKPNTSQGKREGIVMPLQNEMLYTVQDTVDKSLDSTRNEKQNTFQEKRKVRVLPLQNEMLDPVQHTVSQSLDSTRNEKHNTSLEKREVIVLPLQNEKLNSVEHSGETLNSLRNENQNMTQEKREVVVLPLQNEMVDPVQHTVGQSLDSTRNEKQNTSLEKREVIVLPLQNEKLDSVEHSSETLNSLRNENQNMTQEKREVIVLPLQNEKLDLVIHSGETFKNIRNENQNMTQKKPEVIVLPYQKENKNPVQNTKLNSLNNTNDVKQNMSQEKREIIVVPRQKEKYNLVQHTKRVSLDNTNNENQNASQDKRDVVVVHQKGKQNPVQYSKRESFEITNNDEHSYLLKDSNIICADMKVVEGKKSPIDMGGDEPLKIIKSEIRKVTGKKILPLTVEDKIFIEVLETRMLSFLKTQYTVTSLIHKGKYSRIYQCIDLDGYNYALKILNNTRDRYLGIQKENMLKAIQAEIPKEKLHCVYFINGFSMSGYWCFLMEYYPQTLYEALHENDKSFHINTVQVLAKQLIVAVTVLRNNNIVHSDIKPSHILINNKHDKIKLCGFDRAYYIKDCIMAPNIGTTNYRAPEVILGYSSGFSLDVWSTALVMYEMATLTKLFPGFFNNDILYKQQCTLGGIPEDMLYRCMFKDNHFYGRAFMRRVGINKEVIKFVYKFIPSKRIHRTLFDVYAQDWSDVRTEFQRCEDLAKLADFQMLLEQMLVMHPNHRLSIEFVFANPFIYEYSEMP